MSAECAWCLVNLPWDFGLGRLQPPSLGTHLKLNFSLRCTLFAPKIRRRRMLSSVQISGVGSSLLAAARYQARYQQCARPILHLLSTPFKGSCHILVCQGSKPSAFLLHNPPQSSFHRTNVKCMIALNILTKTFHNHTNNN